MSSPRGFRDDHSAWVFQDPKMVEKHGTEEASWYVGWIDLGKGTIVIRDLAAIEDEQERAAQRGFASRQSA